jgi:transcriptional regulator
MKDKKQQEDLLPGTLDLLILKTVTRRTMHGYDIVESIQMTSDDVFHVEEGALYQSLHRLELRGLLDSEWGLSENNRRAKFYHLTAQGRAYLAKEAQRWNRVSAAVTKVLESN